MLNTYVDSREEVTISIEETKQSRIYDNRIVELQHGICPS